MAEVITYPGPVGLSPSGFHAVDVSQDARPQKSFVNLVKSQWKTNKHKDTSWTTFSFSGRVTVRVTRLAGAWKTCRILPSSYGITVRREGNAAVFDLDRPRKLSVEFDNDTSHPMLIFADPLEMDIPRPDSPNVIYFGPGVHVPKSPIEPKSGQTVYLAGGAWVRGRIAAQDAKNVVIRGRGVLCGEDFAERSSHFISLRRGCDHALIEGITLVNSPHFNLTVSGTNSIARNLKMISWWFSSDGADLGQDGLIEDCFFKVNDDAVKLYHSGVKVRNCVFWQMENGAPFQISWNMPGVNGPFHVSDCDVIRVEHQWNNDNEAVFNAIHGGDGRMHDYVFENIRIENCNWRLANLLIKPNEFAKAKTRGWIDNLTFRNITLTDCNLKKPGTIKGFDAEHRISNVTFENLKINGRLIRTAEEGDFQIDPDTTSNVRFLVTPGAAGR